MTDDKKKELFPFFALMYSQQLNPEKYGAVGSYEEWAQLLEQSPEDVEQISSATSQLTDEDWVQLEADYNTRQGGEETLVAKKGAKLNHLKELQQYKKGKKMTKKCSCGCDMVVKKMAGGKMVSKCSCGCGGTINK